MEQIEIVPQNTMSAHPSTDTNTIDVLAPSLAEAPPLMARLQQLPEVARVTSLESFIPQDQDEKLAIIAPEFGQR